ncbi:hypothetical protein HWV62_18748 [Athelia sp. TMB]|nr:hypothetical protein HWV62_18748 [Athelia sp. TMB]
MDPSPGSYLPLSSIEPTNAPLLNEKKPRHRHSPSQLVALNALYEKTEHPSLDERTSLGQQIAMETKTVNAWFQNKRASNKKKSARGHTVIDSYDLPPITHLSASGPSSPQQQIDELDDDDDDEFQDDDRYETNGPSALVAALDDPKRQSLFYAGNPEHRHYFAENESMPRRMRMRNRPSAEQTDELRKLYKANQHPSKDEREELGERIGMTLKSITNWFQNQRSQAKKRREEEEAAEAAHIRNARAMDLDSRMTFPPASSHPSLDLPPPSSHPSLNFTSRELPRIAIAPRSVATSDASPSPRRSANRRGSTPYRSGGASAPLTRPRRTRPEPFQLEELKKLNARTSNPTIEERAALALEIGMDVGKVTNWFRNLRQTARKRAQKTGPDAYGGHYDYSSLSRTGTPSLHSHSSASSANELNDGMDVDEDYDAHSDAGSEDEHEEAVTPSPDASPAPGLLKQHINMGMIPDTLPYAQLGKLPPASKCGGVKIEDALLLLSFHKHVV